MTKLKYEIETLNHYFAIINFPTIGTKSKKVAFIELYGNKGVFYTNIPFSGLNQDWFNQINKILKKVRRKIIMRKLYEKI